MHTLVIISLYVCMFVYNLCTFILMYVYVVAENEPTTTSETSANHSGEDSSDGDSSSAPTIATGIIAAIAIVALIVIGVIFGACYLRYIRCYILYCHYIYIYI